MATITKRNNTYLFRVSVGIDGNGTRMRKCTTWTPPSGMTPKQADKEAKHQAALFEEKCLTGQVLDGGMRLNDFIDIWLASYAEPQLRPKTIDRYKQLLPRIQQALGNMKLDKIQPHHLNMFYKNLAEGGIREDTKYHAVIDLRSIMKEKRINHVVLAELCGICVNTTRTATQGKNIRREKAKKICDVLKIDFKTAFAPCETKPLSAQTRKHHHRLLSVIFNTAVMWGALFANPCARVKPPRVEPKEPKYLDEEQAAALIQASEAQDNFQYQVMIKLLLYTGMRRGECCGLLWSDINFTKSLLSVNKSLLYTTSKGVYFDSTKNFTSYRDIKLPIIAVHLIRDYQKWQENYKYELGSKWIENNCIFPARNGSLINPNSFSQWFGRFVKKYDLPDISPHSLRHTNASLQIAGGVSLPAVAKRLGHSNPTTTSKIYSHAIRSADEAAAEVLQDILAPMSNRKIKRA
jgi:integrase